MPHRDLLVFGGVFINREANMMQLNLPIMELLNASENILIATFFKTR
jgi:hypothetical protein